MSKHTFTQRIFVPIIGIGITLSSMNIAHAAEETAPDITVPVTSATDEPVVPVPTQPAPEPIVEEPAVPVPDPIDDSPIVDEPVVPAPAETVPAPVIEQPVVAEPDPIAEQPAQVAPPVALAPEEPLTPVVPVVPEQQVPTTPAETQTLAPIPQQVVDVPSDTESVLVSEIVSTATDQPVVNTEMQSTTSESVATSTSAPAEEIPVFDTGNAGYVAAPSASTQPELKIAYPLTAVGLIAALTFMVTRSYRRATKEN